MIYQLFPNILIYYPSKLIVILQFIGLHTWRHFNRNLRKMRNADLDLSSLKFLIKVTGLY